MDKVVFAVEGLDYMGHWSGDVVMPGLLEFDTRDEAEAAMRTLRSQPDPDNFRFSDFRVVECVYADPSEQIWVDSGRAA